MKRTLGSAVVLVTLMSVPVASANPGGGSDAAPASTNTLVMNSLVGEWDAEILSRNRDGSWPEETTRAIWRWCEILDGEALQDDWIKVVEGDPGKEPTLQTSGTNIRIHNAEEKLWHMARIDRNFRRLATFTATDQDGTVVMTGHNAQGRMVRITFSRITETTFDWQQEWTMDDGATWFPVASITCTRRK